MTKAKQPNARKHRAYIRYQNDGRCDNESPGKDRARHNVLLLLLLLLLLTTTLCVCVCVCVCVSV